MSGFIWRLIQPSGTVIPFWCFLFYCLTSNLFFNFCHEIGCNEGTLRGHSHPVSTSHGCKVTLGMCMSPCMGILTSRPPCVGMKWLQGCVCWVVPSTTQSHLLWQFSPCIHLVWSFSPYVYLMCAWGALGVWLSSCPLCHRKVTLFGHPHLHTKTISFTSHGKIPKKSRSNTNSINKVPLMSHQLTSRSLLRTWRNSKIFTARIPKKWGR